MYIICELNFIKHDTVVSFLLKMCELFERESIRFGFESRI